MAYASLADLIERAGLDEILQIADRDMDGSADPEVIAAALAHADNIVNGYIATRYRLPLAAVPDLVRTWAVSIARYHLHRDGPPDHVVRDYKTAEGSLEKVAGGKITLPVESGSDPLPPSVSGGVRIVGPEPTFSQDKLKGWL